ncbi:MAG: aminotransferase class I/II-fold pyridoxal phosphate-dependent enzyme [Syntrophobacteraceae bacterium]|nr:aminotransferase class I/II-fold pyridoxal phosphate-dependent enzyme [Syntrophobacteraceae bacterium]
MSTRSALEASGRIFRSKGISRRVRQITISAIKEMPLLASRLEGCVSLGQGIPSFPTPPHIVEAVCHALRDLPESGKYTLGPGMARLREAIAEHLQRDKGIHAAPDREICVTVGAMEALSAAVLTVVDRGDEVILPSPNYASHIEQVLLAEGVPVFVPLGAEDWQLDVEAMARAVTPRTRSIIVCNPHNPTGANFREADLRALAALAVERDLFVIADETYDFLTFDGQPHFSLATLPELKDRIIATYSFSKKYAMTGWRVGYVHASEGVLDQIMKVHDAVAICAPAVSQIAALAALEGPQECVAEIRGVLERRRNLICSSLDRLKGYFSYVRPRGAYYLMARMTHPGVSSMDLALRLLNEARVITIPGAAFGPEGEQHIRLSFGGLESEIVEALKRMEAWLDRQAFS